MSKCDEPFFDICEKCDRDTSGRCIAEQEYMRRVIAKMDENERLFLLWILAKAKGAEQWDETAFAAAIAAAMKKAGASE